MADFSDDKSSETEDSELQINHISLTRQVERKIEKARGTSSRFCCGYLVGTSFNDQINILDLIELNLLLFENVDLTLPLPDSVNAELAIIRASYPIGLSFLGVFITQPENGNLEVAEHLLKILKKLEDIGHATNYLVCLIKPSSLMWLALSGEDVNEHNFDFSHVDNDVMKSYQTFRINHDFTINWLVNSGVNGFQAENDSLMVKQKFAFLVSDVFLLAFDDDSGYISLEGTCKDLVNIIKKKQSNEEKSDKNMNIIDVNCMTQSSYPKKRFGNGDGNVSDEGGEEIIQSSRKINAPVLFIQKIASEVIKVSLHLDVLVMAPYNTPALELLYMFRDAVYRQHNALSMIIKSNHCKILFEPMHFQLDNAILPVTVFLPKRDFQGKEITEEDSKTHRINLHQRFLIADNRPSFRKCVSLFSGRKTYHLVNPHQGLSTPNIGGGQLAIVQGRYAYHHYMQDNFDDNIWGCAYRSLQTLASWFWYQGYTDKKYPSHKEIQEALVEMGDKEKSFIGSNEWIGSMEVSYCLDHLYGVTSKTLHVSTGAEMAYKGREIYQHFIEQGTPIMIGGGVLAHTIVGVIYNEHTGDIRYLIVDPHYTGHDLLKSIHAKGWVGWKNADFWNKTAHYNMCMPQRPDIV